MSCSIRVRRRATRGWPTAFRSLWLLPAVALMSGLIGCSRLRVPVKMPERTIRLSNIAQMANLDFGVGARLLTVVKHPGQRNSIECEIDFPARNLESLREQLQKKGKPKPWTTAEFIKMAREQSRKVNMARLVNSRKSEVLEYDGIGRPIKIYQVFIDKSDPKRVWIYLAYSSQ